jgi:hypothetical protein
MASVTVMTAEKVEELHGEAVVSASTSGGNLTLTKADGSTVNAGSLGGGAGDASETAKGLVELATDTETIAGTDGTRAVTPLGLSALTATDTRKGLVELATTTEAITGTDTARAVTPAGVKAVADTLQPKDTDLTAIAALTGTNDNVIQRKSGAWTERTMAQLATDLSATGEWPNVMMVTSGSYADVDSVHIYIGTTDPGSVANGSIWFDTTP